SFTKDNNGTLAELRVGPPDAYLPEPEDEKQKRTKKRKAKEDPF
ncbi:phage baseplate assembly protein, partial [Citrobacter amalonaticus]|nr:baseplate protein [Citrobacter amalonaticus]